MDVRITEMHSIRDAIRSMYFSKRSWSRQKEFEIIEAVTESTYRDGQPHYYIFDKNHNALTPAQERFVDMVSKLFKWGQKHTTMLRFIDVSCVVDNLHRGAVDDFDSHAKRLENRIIRTSTRLSDYESGEMSDWYKEKILTTDMVLNDLGINLPDEVTHNGKEYVRSVNGYVLKGMEENKDVKRGLYMLSIPMSFSFKVNLVELAHIYRERGSKEGGANGTAAPELQEMMEKLMDELQRWYPMLTREYLLGIRN